MSLSITSWNVEHFGNGSRDRKGHLKPEFKTKVQRIVNFIHTKDPDIVALYEVKGADVFYEFMDRFAGYNFFITEGRQTQEILVGVRSGITSFVTQKLDFKAGNPHLRPGLLLTVMHDSKRYTFLFLHLKSTPTPNGWGLRDYMWEKVRRLKKALNARVSDPSVVNLIVLGDLNTMGMNVVYGNNDVSADEELSRFERMVSSKTYAMKLLSKSHSKTFSNGTGKIESDLDHVFASSHIDFAVENNAQVQVLGWPQKPEGAEKDRWINDYSDHGMLYFEIL